MSGRTQSHDLSKSIFSWLLLVPLCLHVSAGMGAEEKAEESGDPIPALLKKLESDDATEREAASSKLLKLGEKVRPQIQKALDASEDLNLTLQLKRILRKLGQGRILSRFDAPKMIDLELKDATVGEALAKLEKTFGWKVNYSLDAEKEKKISLSLKGAKFFEAVEAIRAKANLGYQISPQGRDGAADVLPFTLCELGEKGAAAASTSGPYLFILDQVSLSTSRSVNLAAGNVSESRSLSVQAKLIWEPGLKLSNVGVEKGKYANAKGDSFQGHYPRLQYRNWNQPKGGATVFDFHDSIQGGEGLQGKLSWKTVIEAAIPAKTKTKEVADLVKATGETIKVGEGSVILKGVKKEKNEWKVHLVTSGTAGELFRLSSYGRHRMAMAMVGAGGFRFGRGRSASEETRAGATFRDAAGNRISWNGHSASGDGQGGWDVKLDFRKEPKSLVLRWHEESFKRKYTVELKGIPVP